MKPLPPSPSSNAPWIRAAVLCACLVMGRQIIRISNNADDPNHNLYTSEPRSAIKPTAVIHCPHPFAKGDFDNLQVGMSCPTVLATLRLNVNFPEFAQQTALPHHIIRFVASDGQIIEIEFRKGVLKYKHFFASEEERKEDVANTLQ